MRKFIKYGLSGLIILIVSINYFWTPFEKTPVQLSLENYFKSLEEQIAKVAVWTAETVFKVGVLDDGTNRTGYAQYVCQVLSEKGLDNTWVQIVDIVKLSRDGEWVKLGDYRCNKF
tara:strand:- start:493 stop:840 length:348 start_codon:yes stop_codon:yes gene_type:complete